MIRFPDSALDGIALPTDAKQFLTTVGLPESAPLFTFERSGRLSTIAERYGLDADALEPEAAELIAFPMIGSVDGDPVVLDDLGRVIVVDHNAAFSEAIVVSSSLAQLIDSLDVYRAFCTSTASVAALPASPGVWQDALAEAGSRLQAIDRSAYPGFWHRTLATRLVPLGFDTSFMTLGARLAEVIAPREDG